MAAQRYPGKRVSSSFSGIPEWTGSARLCTIRSRAHPTHRLRESAIETTQEPECHGYTLLLSPLVRAIRDRPWRCVPMLRQRRIGSRARVRGGQRRSDGMGGLRAMPSYLAGAVCAGRLFGPRTASDIARLRPKAAAGAMPRKSLASSRFSALRGTGRHTRGST